MLLELFRPSRTSLEAHLLSDAEGTEDKVKDVIRRGGAGKRIEALQGFVEIQKEHLVRDGRGYGPAGAGKSCERRGDRLLLPQVRQQSCIGSRSARSDDAEDRPPQLRQALAGKGRGLDSGVSVIRRRRVGREIVFVESDQEWSSRMCGDSRFIFRMER